MLRAKGFETGRVTEEAKAHLNGNSNAFSKPNTGTQSLIYIKLMISASVLLKFNLRTIIYDI